MIKRKNKMALIVVIIVVTIALSIVAYDGYLHFNPLDEPSPPQERWRIVDAHYSNYTSRSKVTVEYLGENDAIYVRVSGRSVGYVHWGHTFSDISKGETIVVEWLGKTTSLNISWEIRPYPYDNSGLNATFVEEDIQFG